MSSTSLPEQTGKSLLTTKTTLSALAGLFLYFLPTLLSWLGIPTDQQGAFIDAIHQVGPPLAFVLTAVGRAVATTKVTSLLPKRSSGTNLLRALPIILALGLCFSIVGAGLSGCASIPGVGHQTVSQQIQTKLTASWTALRATAEVVQGLAESRVLHGANAAKAAKALNDVTVILAAADQAFRAGRLLEAQAKLDDPSLAAANRDLSAATSAPLGQ